MSKDMQEIISNLVDIIEYNKPIKYKTIDIVNIAFHEAQIDLRNYLENASEMEKKNTYDYMKFKINKLVENGFFYKYFDNKEKTGFTIQPYIDTDMSHPNQYTFVILDECEDIIA